MVYENYGYPFHHYFYQNGPHQPYNTGQHPYNQAPPNFAMPGPSNPAMPGSSNYPMPGSSNFPMPGSSYPTIPGPSNYPMPGPSNLHMTRPSRPRTRGPSSSPNGAAMTETKLETLSASTSKQQNSNYSSSSGRSTPNNVSDPAPGKLFVGGLSWQTTSEKLRDYFTTFGTVTDVLIMKDPVTQRSRGFGFITFEDPSSVGKVLAHPSHMLDGKKIDPKYATPKNRPRTTSRTKKVFVGGVSQDTCDEELRAYFIKFGAIDEACLLLDNNTKRHRGFGFVTFQNEECVEKVCDIHYHTIKGKKVEVKKAQPKDQVAAANNGHLMAVGKRIMLTGLGVRMGGPGTGAALAANPLAVAHAQAAQAQVAVAAAVQAQSAAASMRFPYQLGHYRYAPYPMPGVSAVTAGAHAAAAAAAANVSNTGPTPAAAAPTLAPPVNASPYQGYNLANVDMSSFQGVDWSQMYMYM